MGPGWGPQVGLLNLFSTASAPCPVGAQGGWVAGTWEESPCAQHLFILQIFTESLVCARHCSRHTQILVFREPEMV